MGNRARKWTGRWSRQWEKMSLFAAPGHKGGGKIRGKGGEAPRGGEIEVEGGGGLERKFFCECTKNWTSRRKKKRFFFFFVKNIFWPPRLVTAKAKMKKKWNVFLGAARH